MTADERIEKLLNRFGQTISDLPKPTEEDYAYEEEHRRAAREAAMNWSDMNYAAGSFLKDYICHLADVIDRLEIALETAAKWADCSTCAVEYLEECECSNHCNYRICDCYLRDEVTKEEVEALDEDH